MKDLRHLTYDVMRFSSAHKCSDCVDSLLLIENPRLDDEMLTVNS